MLRETDMGVHENGGRLSVMLDGVDVADLIRTPEISQMASKVSAQKTVRQRMLELQRAAGGKGHIVAEGRDIGTVIFPGAEIKIYLDASLDERARRRYEECAPEAAVSFERRCSKSGARPARQRARLAPLCKAEDAGRSILTLTADAVAERVLDLIRSLLTQHSVNQEDRARVHGRI